VYINFSRYNQSSNLERTILILNKCCSLQYNNDTIGRHILNSVHLFCCNPMYISARARVCVCVEMWGVEVTAALMGLILLTRVTIPSRVRSIDGLSVGGTEKWEMLGEKPAPVLLCIINLTFNARASMLRSQPLYCITYGMAHSPVLNLILKSRQHVLGHITVFLKMEAACSSKTSVQHVNLRSTSRN
jgi:hypothetical protein